MKRKRISPKEKDDSTTKDPTETNMEPNSEKDTNKEDADNTGTDTDSDATESKEERSKHPGKFDKNKREVDPDMTLSGNLHLTSILFFNYGSDIASFNNP
jgi:hypothetical protein